MTKGQKMGRTTNYRENTVNAINALKQKLSAPGIDPFEGAQMIGLTLRKQASDAEKTLRLLDALSEIGLKEGNGFCDEIAAVTGYSKTRISNMFSAKKLNPRFVVTVCSGFGLNEEFVINGIGTAKSENRVQATNYLDVAITEAIAVLKAMTEPGRWRSVAVLKELLLAERQALSPRPEGDLSLPPRTPLSKPRIGSGMNWEFGCFSG